MRLALRVGADVICEKPLVINPWNLDALAGARARDRPPGLDDPPAAACIRSWSRCASGCAQSPERRHSVRLTYITARGGWYHVSWKGHDDRSGGIVTNIGIHFFDLLVLAVRAGAEVGRAPARAAARRRRARARARGRAVVPVDRDRRTCRLRPSLASRPPSVRSRWTARRSSSARASPISTPASTKRCSPAAASASTTRARRSSCTVADSRGRGRGAVGGCPSARWPGDG